MEKTIRIFIAGAKALKQERNCIKVLANDLSSKYESRGIHIIAHSYEHFDDDQKSYNNYIEKAADIVIFILNGRIGSKTEEEFIKATDSFKRENRPEIILFVHDYSNEELTADIGRIQGLIAGRLGDKYHVDYSSLDDLRNKARERIERFVEQYVSQYRRVGSGFTGARKTKKISNLSTWVKQQKKLFYYLLGCLVLLLGFGILKLYRDNNKPIVIFAGGGSVVNYIKDLTHDSVDIRSSDYIYMNLGSGTSWDLLAEEANRYNNNEGQRRIISICLSADEIDTSFFNEKTKNCWENACIVGYFLGEDPLMVYLSEGLAEERHISNDSIISHGELAKLIRDSKKDSICIFSTSEKSGTLRQYQKCLKKIDRTLDLKNMLESGMSHLFYQDTKLDYINKLSSRNDIPVFAILGSKHYTVNSLLLLKSNDAYKKFYLKDDSGLVCKPMYVYFVASKNDQDLNIQEPIIEFLKNINAERHVNESIWKNIMNGRLYLKGRSERITYINKNN